MQQEEKDKNNDISQESLDNKQKISQKESDNSDSTIEAKQTDKQNKVDDLDDNLKNRKELEKKLKDLSKTFHKIGLEKGKRRADGKRGVSIKESNNGWKKSPKTLLIWLIIILISFVILYKFDRADKIVEIEYSNFEPFIEQEQVSSIKVSNLSSVNSEITGKFKEPQEIDGKTYEGFSVNYPLVNKEVAEEWREKYQIEVHFEIDKYGLTDFLLSLAPWILFIFIWFYIMRRMQGGGQGGGRNVFGFGKSKAKIINKDENKITFADVAGAEEAKEDLQEVIDFLKRPQKFHEIGARIPKGMLLTGPPGTGKTLLAKAVAGESGVPFFSMSGSDFVEMFVGVGASRVRDLFEKSKQKSPCIIFIDELDAVGRHRGTGIGGGNDEREQTLNQLLVEMDGFSTSDNVIVLASTNRPDVLDPALLRPGRFDRNIVVDRPDVKAREEILKVHAKKIKLDDSVKLDVIAKGTPGLSGADLANLINEAALFAARSNRKIVVNDDIEEAKDKVTMGAERKSATISENEKRLTAYHEAGHVLIAMLTDHGDPVHKVTIIPRGRAMGVTHYLPMEEKHSYSRKYIMSKLYHLFGGRIAEEIIFDEITTGASNDIERATELARKMVCEWGMSDQVGPIHYTVKDENPFLGKRLSKSSGLSEEINKKIDEAVQTIIFAAIDKTREVLSSNKGLLTAIAEELLEKETLTATEIDEIVTSYNSGKNNHSGINSNAEEERHQE